MSDKSEYGCYVKLKQFLQQNNITPPPPQMKKKYCTDMVSFRKTTLWQGAYYNVFFYPGL